MSRDFPPNEVEKSRRQLGAGKDFTGMAAADIAAVIAEAAQCDAGQLPTLWQVRDHFQGPLLDANINAIFQPQTDILALGKAAPGAANVAVTQGLINGELQTPSLICGVFVHVSTSPWTATVPGNSITKPTATYNNDYVSPDVFTLGDVTSLSASTTALDTALGVAQGASAGSAGSAGRPWTSVAGPRKACGRCAAPSTSPGATATRRPCSTGRCASWRGWRTPSRRARPAPDP